MDFDWGQMRFWPSKLRQLVFCWITERFCECSAPYAHVYAIFWDKAIGTVDDTHFSWKMRNLPQSDTIFRLQVGDASHEDNPIISYYIIWYPIDVSPSSLWRWSLSPRLSSWCRKVCTKLSNDFHGIFPRISWPPTIQDHKENCVFSMEPVGFSAGQPHLPNRAGRGYRHQWRVHGCPVGEIRRVARGSKGISGISGGSRGGGFGQCGKSKMENLYRKRGRERERECLYILAQRLKWTVSKFGLEDAGRWLSIFLGSMLKLDKRRSKYMGTIFFQGLTSKIYGSFLPQQIEGFDYGKWVMQWTTISKWLTGFDQSKTGMHPEIDQETSKIGWSDRGSFVTGAFLQQENLARLSPP